ncbi:two-component system, NarL family, sensor histidine kinase DesK [Gracilibacillus ureilyticus]|uniref:histidine kinase n=1 Tax=Gracilibacillus ureilyticus TaxID=531814 RepID=A0A1H9NJD5_9BACI|nr:two-component system, NarL family, sensor histidine kinase DesK [Gracilibacillus ureilyticus]
MLGVQNWYHIFPKNTGLSLYIWIIFCVLPFYFIFRSTSLIEIGIGIGLTLIFFAVYWITFSSRGKLVYVGISVEFLINIAMIILFGYVYFALFTAFFIGNIKRKSGFITIYVIHLVTTVLAILVAFLLNYSLIVGQSPFLVMTVLGIILIPINRYNRLKQEELEGKLEDANRKIARLAIIEERNRIARDLHDTLGQKLSMIGLKSELSGKLIDKDSLAAKKEMEDIQKTARQALKEVREMVSEMRSVKITDEIEHVKQLLHVAQIKHKVKVELNEESIPLFIENVLSMCLKEAVTNVVKHSQATFCNILIKEDPEQFLMAIKDDGSGAEGSIVYGNGLKGMKERLEFVNGDVDVNVQQNGLLLSVTIPKVIKQLGEGSH